MLLITGRLLIFGEALIIGEAPGYWGWSRCLQQLTMNKIVIDHGTSPFYVHWIHYSFINPWPALALFRNLVEGEISWVLPSNLYISASRDNHDPWRYIGIARPAIAAKISSLCSLDIGACEIDWSITCGEIKMVARLLMFKWACESRYILLSPTSTLFHSALPPSYHMSLGSSHFNRCVNVQTDAANAS